MSRTVRGRAFVPQVERFVDRVSRLDRALREAITRYGAPLATSGRAPGPPPGVPGQGRPQGHRRTVRRRCCLPVGPSGALVRAVSHRRGGTAGDRVPTNRQRVARRGRRRVGGLTMSACSEPGCTGIIEDGYCNTCGMAEGSAPPAATGGTAGPSSDPSTQPPRSVRTVGVGRTAAGSAGGVAEAPSVSSRLASTPIGSARTTGGSKRTRRLRGRGPARSRLGAGLTTVPVAPLIDPMLALMSPAVVAEDKRYCSNCGAAVGRGRDGEPGRTKGFCPQCRTPYDFEPKLGAGVLLGGQYEVMGCLAHGGMGWIYLARDRNVNDRWVVLKGLLNAGDPDAYRAAVGEKAVPGRGRASADRRDLQLRDRRRRQLATSSWSTSAARA